MFNKIKNGSFSSTQKSSRADSIFSNTENIESYDDELWSSFKNESQRQEDHVELIASENYASNRILEAQGSILTNNMPKAIHQKGIMEGVSMLMLRKSLQLKELKSYLEQHTQTFNHTLALQQMLQHF